MRNSPDLLRALLTESTAKNCFQKSRVVCVPRAARRFLTFGWHNTAKTVICNQNKRDYGSVQQKFLQPRIAAASTSFLPAMLIVAASGMAGIKF